MFFMYCIKYNCLPTHTSNFMVVRLLINAHTYPGWLQGHVTSFLGNELERYTAFQAHHSDVRQLLPTPTGLLSITADELRYTTRLGLPIFRVWYIRSVRATVY